MARVSKDKIKKEENSVFQMIIGVTFVALLASINLFFFEPVPGDESVATADVAASADNSVFSAEDLILPKSADVKISDFNPLDPMPQCNFQTNVRNIIYGQPVTFLWDCMNAKECSLDGVGSVPVVKEGGLDVFPKRSAKYQLVCSNKEGSRAFEAEVGVFEFSLKEIEINK